MTMLQIIEMMMRTARIAKIRVIVRGDIGTAFT
jgi:hypothetical protein